MVYFVDDIVYCVWEGGVEAERVGEDVASTIGHGALWERSIRCVVFFAF